MLLRRQAVEGLGHGGVGQLQGFVDRLTEGELGHHRGGGDRRTATEGLELDVLDDVILDLEENLHDIAAGGVTDLTDAVGILDLADVSRVAEMIHHFLGIHGVPPGNFEF